MFGFSGVAGLAELCSRRIADDKIVNWSKMRSLNTKLSLERSSKLMLSGSKSIHFSVKLSHADPNDALLKRLKVHLVSNLFFM